ncbi:MAG TPA: hypothetical protein VLT88_13700 [Desulfosarcina sp.]|nr:hypothetical protein [Desulfosarcina sp.]
MKIIAFLLGLVYIVTSSFYILYTRETMRTFKKFIDSYELRYLSVIPAATGLLFLVGANAVRYPWLFRIIAVIAFAEAVLAIVNPNKIFSRMLDWFLVDASDRTNQLFGIIGVILGTLFISWIR